jgi:hypothetical protein
MVTAALDVMRNMVHEVGFDSAITPEYRSVNPLAPAPASPGGGVGATIMGLLKPVAWVRTPAGTSKWAPYGEPSEEYKAALAVGAVVGTVAVVGGLVAIGMWLERRKRGRGRRR